jgi:ligand-binding sensor domain-containing protein
MGLGIDHNFWERGIERNQYYCSQESLVDRSFTSFLVNAEFYILGKREFDRFNSTIDFKLESSQNDIGSRALVPLSSLQVGSLVWVGTENGIFVLDASSPDLEISDTIQVGPLKNAIRDLGVFLGDFWIISSDGIYISEDGITFEKNIGNGLPSSLFSIVSLNNVVILATSDAIYYSDGINDVPSYSIWFRGNFVEGETNEEVIVNLPCQAMATGDSLVYAGIGRGIYRSTDGKVWRHVFDFDDDEITIVKMIYFSRKLYIGTNKGLFTDDGTARSTSVGVKLERIDPEGSEIPINDLFVYSDGTTVSLYAVGNKGKVYRLSNEIWTSSLVPGVTAIHEFIITSSGKQIALSNDQIFVQ